MAAQRRRLESVFGERPDTNRACTASTRAHRVADSGELHPTHAVAAVQKVDDVRSQEFVHEKDEDDIEFQWMKSGYLEHFSQIQIFLRDINRTKPHLDELNALLLEFGTPLPSMLSLQMSPWSREMPTLVGPTPPNAFVEMTVSGKLFEDYVDQIIDGVLSHGIQSHRLQWYLIYKEFGPIAMELYKASVDPVFDSTIVGDGGKKRVRKLWDLIVDASSNDEHDFTQPGKLHRYLHQTYVPAGRGENRLRADIREGQEEFESRKKELNVEKGMHKRRQATEPVGASIDAGVSWSGWSSDDKSALPDNRVWSPTIRQAPRDLETEFETYKVNVPPARRWPRRK